MKTSKSIELLEVRALSVHQPSASWLVRGLKILEFRTWRTPHRGPVLVVSTLKPVVARLPLGKALGFVTLTGCYFEEVEDIWCWRLERPHRFKRPFPMKGNVGLYSVSIPATLLANYRANFDANNGGR